MVDFLMLQQTAQEVRLHMHARPQQVELCTVGMGLGRHMCFHGQCGQYGQLRLSLITMVSHYYKAALSVLPLTTTFYISHILMVITFEQYSTKTFLFTYLFSDLL